jgi:hypothetical protein
MKITNNSQGDRVFPTLGITLKAGESYDTDSKKPEVAKPVVAAKLEAPKPVPTLSAAPDSKLGE